jgi:hypothetical protein
VRSAYAHRRGTCFSPGLASLERLGQPAILVGRRGEYALIGAILDRAAADDAALLLRGEPGAGKTVLLDAAADAASAAGAWVLRPDRVEFKVRWDDVDLYRQATGMIAEESAAWLSAAGASELADKPPYAWTRQESPGLRHMTYEVSPRPVRPPVGAITYGPAAAYGAASRTGGDMPTIYGWEIPDEPACTGQR